MARMSGQQEKEDRRKATLEPLLFPHQCAAGRQRWLGNYANMSGEFSRLHQWVLIAAALHCLQSATLHLGSVNLTGPGYHMPAVLQG